MELLTMSWVGAAEAAGAEQEPAAAPAQELRRPTKLEAPHLGSFGWS